MSTPPNYGYAASLPPRRPRVWPWVVLGVALALVMGGGWIYKKVTHYRPIADAYVEKFHQQLDAEQFDEIINQAAPAFRETAKKEELRAFFSGIHDKMGTHKSARQTFIQLNAQAGIGTLVAVQYDSEYASGKAQESFTLLVTEDGVQLYGYRINAPQMLKP